jgi:hypothetical protein
MAALHERSSGVTLEHPTGARSLMKWLTIMICAAAIVACSDKPPEPMAKPAPVATPFDGLRADEQRAKDVQKTVDKQAEEQRKQIEAQQQ